MASVKRILAATKFCACQSALEGVNPMLDGKELFRAAMDVRSHSDRSTGEHGAAHQDLDEREQSLERFETLIADLRSDLVVGAMGEPPFPGYAVRPIDTLEIGFYLAPNHPLASAGEPLQTQELAKHRAIAIHGTSRQLPDRTVNLSEGQETATVADIDAKLRFLLSGLGVGYLPVCIAQPYVERGLLVGKELDT